MNSPEVSVVIPAYNRALYIRQAVDSVLNQTFKNLQLIVIDDGSNDGTREILESYGNRIRLLEHPGNVNKGQSAAINLGLRHVTGSYIAILDSDDYWEKTKLELQVSYLEANPEIGLVYSNGKAINDQGEYLYDIHSSDHRESNKPEHVLIDCYFSVPSNSLFRTNILGNIGYFDETLRSAQDHDFAIRIAEVTKLGYLNKFLFYYRRHPDTISQKNATLRWENGFIILDKARRRYPYKIGVVVKRKAVLHFRLFQCLFQNREYIKSIIHLLLSGLYDPIRGLKILSGTEKITKLQYIEKTR